MIYDIFKIGVYRVKLELDNKELVNYAHNLENIFKENPANKSNRGGFQTPSLPSDKTETSKIIKSNRGGFHSKDLTTYGIHNENSDNVKILDNLIDNINPHVEKYAKVLGYDNTSLDNIWCNINYYKDFNEIHNHPGGKISGVYYVKTPKNCGAINFYSPSFREVQQAKLGVNDNHYTSQTWWLPAIEGMLYLFPSYIMHNVNPNLNENEERISFSFNY